MPRWDTPSHNADNGYKFPRHLRQKQESFFPCQIRSPLPCSPGRIYRSRYIPIGAYGNTPYPGVRELLETLKSQGHTLYVATSKPEEMSVRILEHFDLAKYFDRICGASMDTSRSSKEAVIAYLIDLNGRADNMVMVGDTKFDIIGAKAHGIPGIGVSWGYGKVEQMQEAGAVAIAESMDALLSLLIS